MEKIIVYSVLAHYTPSFSTVVFLHPCVLAFFRAYVLAHAVLSFVMSFLPFSISHIPSSFFPSLVLFYPFDFPPLFLSFPCVLFIFFHLSACFCVFPLFLSSYVLLFRFLFFISRLKSLFFHVLHSLFLSTFPSTLVSYFHSFLYVLPSIH